MFCRRSETTLTPAPLSQSRHASGSIRLGGLGEGTPRSASADLRAGVKAGRPACGGGSRRP